MLQKETSSALTHAGAHLDLSAFSSWEVSFSRVFLVNDIFINVVSHSFLLPDQSLCVISTGAGVSGSGQIEVCTHGLGSQMWRVSVKSTLFIQRF